MWQVLFRRAFSAFSMAAFAVALGCRWVLVPGWAGRVWVEVAGHPTTSSSCDLKAELCCSCLRSRLQPITFVTYGTSQSQCLSSVSPFILVPVLVAPCQVFCLAPVKSPTSPHLSPSVNLGLSHALELLVHRLVLRFHRELCRSAKHSDGDEMQTRYGWVLKLGYPTVLMGMIRDDDHPMDLVTLFSDKAIRCEGKCAAFGTSHDWPTDLPMLCQICPRLERDPSCPSQALLASQMRPCWGWSLHTIDYLVVELSSHHIPQYTSNWLLQSPFKQNTNSLSPTPNLNSASLRDETLKPIDTRCPESSNTAVSADFRCRLASANLRCAPCGLQSLRARVHHLGTIGYPKIPWFERIFPLKLP